MPFAAYVVLAGRALMNVAGRTTARAALDCALDHGGAVRLRVTGACMEPAILEGELVAIRRRVPRLGDVVLAATPQGLRLHRVIFVLPGGRALRTKGDGSDPWDASIGASDVVGTVVWTETAGSSPRSRWRAVRSLLGALRWRLLVALPCGGGAA